MLDPDGNSIEAVHKENVRADGGCVDHVWLRVRDVTVSEYDAIPPHHYGAEGLGNRNACYGVALTIEVGARRASKRAIVRCPFRR